MTLVYKSLDLQHSYEDHLTLMFSVETILFELSKIFDLVDQSVMKVE